jgi:hypothetical protein
VVSGRLTGLALPKTRLAGLSGRPGARPAMTAARLAGAQRVFKYSVPGLLMR